MSTITVDLNKTDTKAFDNENLIQANAKACFAELINNFLNDLEDGTDCKNNPKKIDRVHNTILINGKRGMGKTSFILSMENAKKNENNEKILNNICSLGIIDPTLIETKEHVFLNIITEIKSKIDDHIKCNSCTYNDLKYKQWKESLKKLAGGLSMLETVGSDHLKDSMWDSPELILEKGLSNAKQGADLERNFHCFIDESLKTLDKKAFFLVLDDIDTSLDKGRDILETMRKYLTSRKLIIAMLGDIDLYSTLVRQLQWEKMDPRKTLIKYEELDNYRSQIEHLEEQYLTKVLKPENRIDLKNLLSLKGSLKLTSKNTEEKEFTKYVQELIDAVYLTRSNAISHYYENILLSQSTRSVIQVLKAWDDNKENNDMFIEKLKHTFYTTLKHKFENHNLLEIPSNEQFLNLLSMFILKEMSDRDTGLSLLPDSVIEEDNIAMLYLNALTNNIITTKDYLAYFIKIGYAYDSYTNFQNKLNANQFIGFTAIDSNITSSRLSEKILTTLEFQSPTTLRTGYKLFGNMFVRNEDIEKNEEQFERLLCKLPGSNREYNFLSFFKYLGFIADISNYYININDEKINQWLKKNKNVAELPFFVLANIWKRTAKTIFQIDNRSENKAKSYKEMFELYIAGFLNAVYVETELYYAPNKKIDIKNISQSADFFYDKLVNGQYYRSLDTENKLFTFFDYLNECPLLNPDNSIFSALIDIPFDTDNEPKVIINKPKVITKNQKPDFSKLSSIAQKNIISTISGWETKTLNAIAVHAGLIRSPRRSTSGHLRRSLFGQSVGVTSGHFGQVFRRLISI